jgi:hypothetical protein
MDPIGSARRSRAFGALVFVAAHVATLLITLARS